MSEETDSTSPPPPEPVQERGPRRLALGLGLGVLSAVLLILSFPQYGGIFPLVLIAFVPMYVAQYRLMPRRWTGVPVAISALGYWGALWLTSKDLLLQYWPVLFAGAVLFAVGYGLIASLDVGFSERTGYRWFLLQLPLWWVALDLLVEDNLLFGSNGWLAYRLAYAPDLIQAVSIVSTPALTLLILLVNASVALWALRWWDLRRPAPPVDGASQSATWERPSAVPHRTAVVASVTVLCLCFGWIVSSLLIARHVEGSLAVAPKVRVAAIQPTSGLQAKAIYLPNEERPTAEQELARQAKQQVQLERLTRQAAAAGAALVVWPEAVLNYDPSEPRGQWISSLAAELQITLVSGYLADWPEPESPNMAAVWGPDGRMQGRTYKAHPVIAALEAFQTPTTNPTFETPFGELGVIICFDHDFPNDSPRLSVRNGAQILAIPSSDWGSIAQLRWQSLVFRAVENRVPLVKAETGYDSAIVAADGRPLEKVGFSEAQSREAVLVQDVGLGPRGAPFTSIGGWWFGLLVLVATCARYAAQVLMWRRSLRGQSPDGPASVSK